MATLLQRLGLVSQPVCRPEPRHPGDVLTASAIRNYRAVAETVGISTRAIEIEELRLFLVEHDVPVFDRATVVKYMDEIAAKTNPLRLGWHWCPVRAKDAIDGTFGIPSRQTAEHITAASDYYDINIKPYTRTLPLHVLEKIALIEQQFGSGQVRFLVSDLVLMPHIVPRPVPRPSPPRVSPDPFLMAVIPNDDLAHGAGCFVIDVWDEPGFGLAHRLTGAARITPSP